MRLLIAILLLLTIVYFGVKRSKRDNWIYRALPISDLHRSVPEQAAVLLPMVFWEGETLRAAADAAVVAVEANMCYISMGKGKR